jgi:hypothetical protein
MIPLAVVYNAVRGVGSMAAALKILAVHTSRAVWSRTPSGRFDPLAGRPQRPAQRLSAMNAQKVGTVEAPYRESKEPEFREILRDHPTKPKSKPTLLERELALPELKVCIRFNLSDLRREYVKRVKFSGEFWARTAGSGWNPDPALSEEDNTAAHFNFIVQKKKKERDRELELRMLEIAEEERCDRELELH